jgi:hypothetical protein
MPRHGFESLIAVLEHVRILFYGHYAWQNKAVNGFVSSNQIIVKRYV